MHTANTFKVGLATVAIVQDDVSGQDGPIDDAGENVVFIDLSPRYRMRPDWAKNRDDIEAYVANHDVWELPLFKYDHSMVAYRIGGDAGANPFIGRAQHAEWDSGRCGSLLLAKSEWATEDDARKFAESFCQSVTDWVNGNVWGFVVSVPDNDNVDSVWGFIGDSDDKYLIEQATESAKQASEEYAGRLALQQEEARPDMYQH